MAMNSPDPSPPDDDAIVVEAGAWLARRDRGLNATEQDAFLQWLRDDERHRVALARLECTWSALDSLAQWQPDHSPTPNPRLLASSQHRSRRISRRVALVAGIAAMVGVLATIGIRTHRAGDELAAPTIPQLRVIPPAEQQLLSDGTRLDINHGSQFDLAFSASERRLRLLRGELHVTVTKDPARPFIVETDGLEVRAVGTAFAVRRAPDAVDVVVTEGLVHLEMSETSRLQSPPVAIASGERARIDTTSRNAAPVIAPISNEEMDRELAWQQVRLEFEASPLAAVVTEFNLRNQQQLVIGDPTVGQLRVAGTFRADQVEVFVRLLEASFGVQVERPAAGPWVLRQAESVR